MPKYICFMIFLTSVAGSLAQIYRASSNPSASNINNNVGVVEAVAVPEVIHNDFITQTVYGFLDFTTTIGNTVMVFSPQSAPAEGEKINTTPATAIQTKPPATPKKNLDIQPTKTHGNKPEIQNETKKTTKNTKIVINSIVQLKSDDSKTEATKNPSLSTVVQVNTKAGTAVKNNFAQPEYDYLSRHPVDVVDETYKLINLRPSKAPTKPRPSAKKERENPTGLVTKLGGTIIKDGLTTVHETSVIGTYINGKYAQVLQSTSHIFNPEVKVNYEGKIRPSSAQRILKTIGPQHGKLRPQLEPTPTSSQPEDSSLPLEGLFNGPTGGSAKALRRHSSGHASRFKFRNKVFDDSDTFETQSSKNAGKNRPTTARPSYKNRALTTTTTESTPTRRRSGFRPNYSQQSSSHNLKPPKLRADPSSAPQLVPKVKLPRTQGRWTYKPPKPRVLRKQVVVVEEAEEEQQQQQQREPVTSDAPLVTHEPLTTTTIVEEKSALTTTVAENKLQEAAPPTEDELDHSETEAVSSVVQNDQEETIIPAETINVEISTPSDLNDVYFEIATIKSPYTFQVGSMKNTRFVTVTSTQKKTFATEVPTTSSAAEPLTENILAHTAAVYESSLPLDSSVATLPAITLDPSQATPPLETLTETFTTSQTLLKTYLLPVVANGNTSSLTLVQTYNIARMVTATKTLPPSEIFQFIPSKTLNEFNSKLDEAGSELHLELDFSEDDTDDEDVPKRVAVDSANEADLEAFRSASKGPATQLEASTPPPTPQLTPEQAQQLALLKYFGQAPQGPQVITTSRPVLVLETLYESHLVPLVKNGNTVYSTLSRAIATVPKTSYEYGTSTISPIVPQIPQVPLFPPVQPQFTVTSSPIVSQTLATLSDSRVLKLTFGAKTTFTTLFNTRVVPTAVTSYVTSTIALQQSLPTFPGFYPQPVGYPPFPYVG